MVVLRVAMAFSSSCLRDCSYVAFYSREREMQYNLPGDSVTRYVKCIGHT